MLKPDPEVFEHVAQRVSVAPERALFLDDNIVNVQAARAAGFFAIQAAGVDAARRALIEAGVIGNSRLGPS